MEYLLIDGKKYVNARQLAEEKFIPYDVFVSRIAKRKLHVDRINIPRKGPNGGVSLYINVDDIDSISYPVTRSTRPAPHENGFLSCRELGKKTGMSRTQARTKIRLLYQKGLLKLYTDAEGRYDYVKDTPETVKLVKKNLNELKTPKEIDGFYPVATLYLHDPAFDDKGISSYTVSTRFKDMRDKGEIIEGVDYKKLPFKSRELFCVRPELVEKLLYKSRQEKRISRKKQLVRPEDLNFDSIIEISRSECPFRTVQVTQSVLGGLHSLENGHERGYYDSILRQLIEKSIRKYGIPSLPFLVTNISNRTHQIMERPVEQVENFLRFAETAYQREKKPDEFIMRLFEWGQN
ncbi:MAG: hypothetical protein JW716_04110 [Candidatus Aenigmarchaeota archaeon]|nr:hypothetical protein [Candidatus Aenigmarchaeota archaeon]